MSAISVVPRNLRCWKIKLAVAFSADLAHLAPRSSAEDSTKELVAELGM